MQHKRALFLRSDTHEPEPSAQLPKWCTHLNMMRLCRKLTSLRESFTRYMQSDKLCEILAATICIADKTEITNLCHIAAQDMMWPRTMRITHNSIDMDVYKVEALLSTYTMWIRGRAQLLRFMKSNGQGATNVRQAYKTAILLGSQWADILVGRGASYVWMMQTETSLEFRVYSLIGV